MASLLNIYNNFNSIVYFWQMKHYGKYLHIQYTIMIININVLNVKGTKFSLRGDLINGVVY